MHVSLEELERANFGNTRTPDRSISSEESSTVVLLRLWAPLGFLPHQNLWAKSSYMNRMNLKTFVLGMAN